MFLVCLGYRRDYVGHYAAGYGGTLAALTAMQAALNPLRYARWAPWVALPGTIVCVALGAVAEATVFRLARFDEVDFCNQSIGAALAGMVVWNLGRQIHKPVDAEFLTCMAAGLVALLTGTYFAIT
jgi:hypothetical protein